MMSESAAGSLFNFLSEAENSCSIGKPDVNNEKFIEEVGIDDHVCDYEGERTTTVRDVTNNNKCPSSSKKYIWDDLSQLDEDSHQSNRSEIQSMSNERSDYLAKVQSSVKSKIKSMQEEYGAKSKQVKDLQTEIARKKISNERKDQKLHEFWKEKIKSQKMQLEQTKIKQFESISQVSNDCNCFLDKKMKLEADIEAIVLNRDKLCFKQKELKESKCINIKNEWSELERKQHSKLGKKGKVEEMKKEAAKKLEPKLRCIVERNEKILKQLRQETEAILINYKTQAYNYTEVKLAKKKDIIEKEGSINIKSIGEHHQKEIQTLHQTHNKELECINVKWNEIIECNKKNLKYEETRKLEEYNKIVTVMKKTIGKELNETRTIKIKELRSFDENLCLSLQHEKHEFETAISADHAKCFELVEEECEKNAKDELIAIEKKAQEEIKIINSKLKFGLENKKENWTMIHQNELKGLCAPKEKEMQNLLHHTVIIENELNSSNHCLLDEEKKLGSIMSSFRKVEVRSESAEIILKEIKKELEFISEVSVDQAQIEAKGAALCRKSKHELSNLQEESKKIQKKNEHLKDEFEQEINEIARKQKLEIGNIKYRINQLLEKKNQTFKQKENMLTSVTQESIDKDSELNEVRKAQILL